MMQGLSSDIHNTGSYVVEPGSVKTTHKAARIGALSQASYFLCSQIILSNSFSYSHTRNLTHKIKSGGGGGVELTMGIRNLIYEGFILGKWVRCI
jgi:hypothetical protein